MVDRYNAQDHPETTFEPGSGRQVLSNLLGIQDPAVMDDLELDLLDQLYDEVLDALAPNRGITIADIREWHRRWLGNVYSWAGKDRSVNMGKGGFQFAAATLVPQLMETLDRTFLPSHTPCAGMVGERLAEAIAVVHVELILIHPFREGNGRLARLLTTVMTMQAGYPEPDFSCWNENKSEYIAAIHAGLDNYEPMKRMVRRVVPALGTSEDE